jgi:hypothetical protein
VRRAIAAASLGDAQQQQQQQQEQQEQRGDVELVLPSLIYVSRNDALNRRVFGEETLMKALRATSTKSKAFVVERVVLSELSAAEARAKFSAASIVLGPHGAGLYNAAIFSPMNTTVISLALTKEDESQEDKIISIFTNELKMRFRRVNVRSRWMGDYTLTKEMIIGIIEGVYLELKERASPGTTVLHGMGKASAGSSAAPGKTEL